jgi:hypothetical protein
VDEGSPAIVSRDETVPFILPEKFDRAGNVLDRRD